MQLRDYQSRSIQMLYQWMSENKGHPCIVMPTGAGKSIVIAELTRQAMQEWPETRVLMLCHQKELIEMMTEQGDITWDDIHVDGVESSDESLVDQGFVSMKKESLVKGASSDHIVSFDGFYLIVSSEVVA